MKEEWYGRRQGVAHLSVSFGSTSSSNDVSYVVVREKPHDVFVRSGDADLVTYAVLTFMEWVLHAVLMVCGALWSVGDGSGWVQNKRPGQ